MPAERIGDHPGADRAPAAQRGHPRPCFQAIAAQWRVIVLCRRARSGQRRAIRLRSNFRTCGQWLEAPLVAPDLGLDFQSLRSGAQGVRRLGFGPIAACCRDLRQASGSSMPALAQLSGAVTDTIVKSRMLIWRQCLRDPSFGPIWGLKTGRSMAYFLLSVKGRYRTVKG